MSDDDEWISCLTPHSLIAVNYIESRRVIARYAP